MPNPGDVVVVDFPGAQGVKRRPAVIISSATYLRERPDMIIGLLTTNVGAAVVSSDYLLAEWTLAGLTQPSAFRTYLVTLKQSDIRRVAGSLSPHDWLQVQQRISTALALLPPISTP